MCSLRSTAGSPKISTRAAPTIAGRKGQDSNAPAIALTALVVVLVAEVAVVEAA